MLSLSTAEAVAAASGEIAFFNDTAIYFYRCLIGSSITNIETQSEPSPPVITSTKALMTVANISNLICRWKPNICNQRESRSRSVIYNVTLCCRHFVPHLSLTEVHLDRHLGAGDPGPGHGAVVDGHRVPGVVHTVNTVPPVTSGLCLISLIIKHVVDVDLIWILDLDQRAHDVTCYPRECHRGTDDGADI